jgi:hypothetical protein
MVVCARQRCESAADNPRNTAVATLATARDIKDRFIIFSINFSALLLKVRRIDRMTPTLRG